MASGGGAGTTVTQRSQSHQLSRETPSRSRTQLPLGAPDGTRAVAKGGGHKHKKLGMFKGVLVPTCENMWGVIIFLRFYVIVGNAGLGNSLLIVTLSFASAMLTALSLSPRLSLLLAGSAPAPAGRRPPRAPDPL